ncbi:MAG TPA: hypothetical protein VN699_03465 [Pirellulales bacterium]|nr:hypothetical protein [Pirellulales bacterium]
MEFTQLPQRFIDRLFAKAVAEEAAEQLPAREADVKAIADAHARYEATYPAAAKAAQKAEAAFVKAREDFERAAREFQRLRAASLGISALHDSQVGCAEGRLRFGADPAIQEARSQLNRMFQETRRNQNIESVDQPIKSAFGGSSTILPVASNVASITARLRAIETALRKLDDLALQADQGNVPATVEALLASIPKIGRAVAPPAPAVPKVAPAPTARQQRQADRLAAIVAQEAN